MPSRAFFVVTAILLAIVGAVAVVILGRTVSSPSGPPVEGGGASTGPTESAPTLQGRAPEVVAAAPASPAPAEAARRANAAVLVVKVLGLPAGTPVAAVDVLLRDVQHKVLARTPTGPDGMARFEGLPTEEVEVITRAPGRASKSTSVSGLSQGGEHTVTVELAPGVALTGSVLASGSRRPVANAHVEARIGGSLEWISTAYSGPPLDMTQADAVGRFRVEGIPLGEVVSVHAFAPGFVPASRSLMLGEGAAEHPDVELVLEEAAVATGRVVDPGDRPATGARVLAVSGDEATGEIARLEDRLGPWATGLRASGETETDARGEFVLDGLRVGVPYRLYARAAGFARSTITDPEDVPVGPGRMPGRELRLRRAATLRVVVSDEAGTPLEASTARIVMQRDRDMTPEKENAGRYRFDLLPPGTYEVVVQCSGFAAQSSRTMLAEGEMREARVVLERGVAIEGTVVDDLGKPVRGVGVTATMKADERARIEASAATDPDGRFRIEGLRKGLHRVRASAAGYSRGRGETTDAPAPSSGLRFVLARSGKLQLRLLAPRGSEPPAKLEVSVYDLEDGGGVGSKKPWNGGLVVEEQVGPGRVSLVVLADGFAPVVRDERIAPGEERDLGEIALDTGVELTGRVTDVAGEPIAGARVHADVGSFLSSTVATTAADGRYRLSHLRRGELFVRLGAAGYLDGSTTVTLQAGSTTCDFTLARPVEVRGVVRDAEGKPRSGLRVVLLRDGDAPAGIPREVSEWTDAIGAFSLAAAAGTHRVEVRDQDGKTLWQRDAPLAVPAEAALDLTVPR